jgi:putative acetyltransferase
MIVRPQQQADGPAVRDLLTAAFADDGHVARLAEALGARPDRPGVALVAESDGAVVGHVQLSRGWIDTDRQLVNLLVLSPLGVAPAHQRLGVGRALCDAAVAQAEQLGAPGVFLEGDPAYYRRLGWEPASAHGVTRPSVRIPDAACQVRVLRAWQPWMTGALVYNDTFWSFDSVGLRPDR